MNNVEPNQSYLVKEMQFKIAAALAGGLMFDLGANIAAAGEHEPWNDPIKTLWTPTYWRINRQQFFARTRHPRHSGELFCFVKFSDTRWDSQNSELNYGPKTIDQKVDERESGKTKIIRNKTDGDVHVAYAESVELTNAFSASVTQGVTLDMTAEVASEQKVSGSYAGVTAEVSLSEKFGVARGTSKQASKQESEEGTTSESLSIDFVATPHDYFLVDVKKQNEHTSQPFDIRGVMDFDITLAFRSTVKVKNWHLRPGKTITAAGIDELLQVAHGFDTRYPSLEGYWDHAPQHVRDSLDWIADPANRRIHVAGVSHASLDSNADYDIEPLGGDVPDAFADLPVVDAVDA